MSFTVSKCQQFVAEAPADKVKKHPAGDGLYFVVGRGRAYWSYQFRRGTSWSAKGLGGYPEFSPKDARDRLKHWQVTGCLPGEPPRAGPSTHFHRNVIRAGDEFESRMNHFVTSWPARNDD